MKLLLLLLLPDWADVVAAAADALSVRSNCSCRLSDGEGCGDRSRRDELDEWCDDSEADEGDGDTTRLFFSSRLNVATSSEETGPDRAVKDSFRSVVLTVEVDVVAAVDDDR